MGTERQDVERSEENRSWKGGDYLYQRTPEFLAKERIILRSTSGFKTLFITRNFSYYM